MWQRDPGGWNLQIVNSFGTQRAGHVKIQTPAQEVCPSPRLPVAQASWFSHWGVKLQLSAVAAFLYMSHLWETRTHTGKKWSGKSDCAEPGSEKGKARPFSRTYTFYEPIIKAFAAFPKRLSAPLRDSILVNTFPNDLWGCCRNLLCVSELSRHLKTLVIIMTSTTSNGNVQEIILLTSLWERALTFNLAGCTAAQMIAMTSLYREAPDSRGQTQLETTFIIISSPASHICSHTEVHKMS